MGEHERKRAISRIEWLEIWASGAEGRGNRKLAEELRKERADLVFALAAARILERNYMGGAHD